MRQLIHRAVLASAVSAMLVLFGVVSAGAAVPLSGLASPAPVSWTPQVTAGTTNTTLCEQWFGGGCGDAAVLSTTLVNGEVVVAGAFTQVCRAGSSTGHCKAGTTVTRDDLFAYQLRTGIIDPDFVPQLNQGPVYSVIAGPNNTVYVGGAFTTVNSATHKGIVQLNVNPGVTTGPTADGSVVSAFTANVSHAVHAMALNGSALYIGGQFTSVDSTTEDGVARLNATTGAVDATFGISISGAVASGTAVKVEAMAVSPSGDLLAIGGAFLDVNTQSQPRLALISTGGGLGSPASLDDWQSPLFANACYAEHDWVRDLDFSPNGAFLDIGTTGYLSSPPGSVSICDAVARFPATVTGTNIQPTWVNYAGGDSVYAVQDTGAVIYFGGHNRWLNNECGNNSDCEANSVLVMGLAAVDANTGLAIPWFQPLTERGQGTESLTAVPAGAYSGSNGGILIGNDTTEDAGAYHSFDALFPITSTATSPTFGSIPSGLFSQGRVGGDDETANGYAALCVADPGSQPAGTTVQAGVCDNDPGQNWTVQPGGNIVLSNGLCLDTMGEGTASGTLADVNTCGSSATQVWTQGSGNTLVNSASGLCLTYPPAQVNDPTPANLEITPCSSGAVNQVWPLPAAPAPASLTPDGPISSQEQQGSQPPCLTDSSSSLDMSTCIGGPAQEATLQANGNIEIEGLCLDTAGEATASGTQVVLSTCGSSTTQVWSQPGGPGTTLVNKAAGLCLNISSPANRSTADITGCSSTPGQEWWLPAM